MKLEDLLNKNINEKSLLDFVFIPILETKFESLPFISIESRISVERYLAESLYNDLDNVKIELEIFEKLHKKMLEELSSIQSDNLKMTYDECTSSILEINNLLNIKSPNITSTSEYKGYILGTEIKNINKNIDDLKKQIEIIETCYKGAHGYLGDAMSSSNAYKGKRNILIQIENVENTLSKSKEIIDLSTTNKEKQDVIRDIWTSLLIDAVALLKMNDTREKIHLEREKEENKENLKPIFEVFNKTRRTSSYGVEEIVTYFDDFIDYESVLYGMNKHYRDHKKHVLQVWALGVYLINKIENDGYNIYLNDSYKAKPIEFQFTPTNKFFTEKSEGVLVTQSEQWAMWTIIALCHDLGYPIEKTSQINKQAKKIILHFGSMQFTELDYSFSLLNTYLIKKFLNIISSRVDYSEDVEKTDKSGKMIKVSTYKTTVQEKYKDKLSKSLEDFKHGIFSSLLLYKNLTYFLETDYNSGDRSKPLYKEDARQFYLRKEILRSIAGHTCPKLYHIRLDTLAFLLILCDELQEWNRPKSENLLYFTKEEIPKVKIKEFQIGNMSNDTVRVSMNYGIPCSKEHRKHIVLSRFKNIHYLLRSGKDDYDRSFVFEWEISFKDVEFNFLYNSTQPSYEQLIVKEKNLDSGEEKEITLYE